MNIKKIWRDPVWSKVIAGVLLMVITAIVSVIRSSYSETESFMDVLNTVLGVKINLWLALAVVLIVWIVVSIVKQKKNKKNSIPQVPFVNGFTEGDYQRMKWKWRWKWNKSLNIYDLTDLNLVCPLCNEGVLTIGYMNYRCGKCGVEINYRELNVNHDAVKTQILEDAKRNYSSYEDFIGEVN
ncbi:MAG: hypothetical protein IJQ89_07020 [Bacteroidales bacterium]|nr:hypothetical protein [Bacteroidales bacterium]MBQ6726316.1 hypothetical protein [Bacteroidales bacterium]